MKTFLFAALVSAPLASAAMGDCYFPGGTWAAGFKPCNPYAVTTSCCQAGWTCMSNTICALTDPAAASNQSPWGSVQRASCTNPQWNDTACGNFCKSMPVDANDGALLACGDDRYCCKPDSDKGICDCASGKGTFSVAAGKAVTIIGNSALTATSTSRVSAASSSIPASLTRSSTSPTNSATRTSTGTGTSGTSSATPTPSATPITQKTGFKVGISLGLFFGVLAIGFGIWYLLRRRSRRSRVQIGYEPHRDDRPMEHAGDAGAAPDSPGGSFRGGSMPSRLHLAPHANRNRGPEHGHSTPLLPAVGRLSDNGDHSSRTPSPAHRYDPHPGEDTSYAPYRPDPSSRAYEAPDHGIGSPASGIVPNRRPVFGSGALPSSPP